MLDDLFEADNAAAARDLIRRPLPAAKPEPKFSAWSAIPRGVATALTEIGGSAADIGGAVLNARDAPRGQLPTAAFTSDTGESVRDYWRDLKPDPETASTAEQVLFGFSRGMTKIGLGAMVAGPAGVIAAGVQEAMTVSDELRRQGVPEGARQVAGIIQGTGFGAAALPLLGRTLAETAALYVAGGPGGFVAQQALTRKVLENAGQDKIAGSYDPFDPVGLTIAAALPLAFTAAGLRGQKLRADAKAQADFIAGPKPSEPTPVAAAVAEAVRVPELSPEVVDASMVNHLRVADEVAQAAIPGQVAAVQGARLVTGEDGRMTLVNDAPVVAAADKAAYRQAMADGDSAAALEALTRIREAEGRTLTADDRFVVKAKAATPDPLAKLNEPADAPPKPLAPPIPDTIAARAADLEATMPELVVRVDPEGRHVTLAEDLAEVRRIAAEGSDDMLGTLDADLLQVAVNCALSSGG